MPFRRIAQTLLSVGAGLLLMGSSSGCSGFYLEGVPTYSPGSGYAALDETGAPLEYGAQSFNTLTPTLRWSAYSRMNVEGFFNRVPAKLEDVRYHLVVYKVRSLANYRLERHMKDDEKAHFFRQLIFVPEPGMWFVEEKSLTDTTYTFKQPLEPSATYVWTVGVAYTEDGEREENRAWMYVTDSETNRFLLSFQTPDAN